MNAGDEITLTVEKPASGGRMIGRHEGRVVLVLGAIPGERVTARIERVEKRLAFATVTRVEEASADRRAPSDDPLCGGSVFSHIAYPCQIAIKAEIIADAFLRLGKIPWSSSIHVAASPEQGYRMRARFHVRAGRAGFFREGSHELCDAGTNRHLLEPSVAAVHTFLHALEGSGDVASIELSENVAGDQRALHVEAGSALEDAEIERALAEAGLPGCTVRVGGRDLVAYGNPVVADTLAVLSAGRASAGTLSRHPESFFQANRHLIAVLVTSVLDAIEPASSVVDLYAGVGLFSVNLAATGNRRVIAVEGDRSSGADLARNAAQFPDALEARLESVEHFLHGRHGKNVETVLVDPPRTGISREAMEAVARLGARRVVYVSCDPATMARDARRLLDAGYVMTKLDGFDLFPNTPHVESLGVFDRA
jgi:23S rRNA (uracil1939-C5)-methyltransferase